MITTNIEMTADFGPAFDMSACASVSNDFRTRGVKTTLSAYRGTTGVLVIKGAFPGTSAWSPPI